ncbi:hypothetical protein BHE74_00004892 [Ensete ventricosum]|nr:hypothetical protein BHE74_00004892 [Ensete ventricosum]
MLLPIRLRRRTPQPCSQANPTEDSLEDNRGDRSDTHPGPEDWQGASPWPDPTHQEQRQSPSLSNDNGMSNKKRGMEKEEEDKVVASDTRRDETSDSKRGESRRSRR